MNIGLTKLLPGVWVLCVSLLAFTSPAPLQPENRLDPSWMLALNQAVAQGMVFGRDIVFTMGPYSTLFTQAYHPATFSLAMVLGTLFGLCYAALLLTATSPRRQLWLMAYTVFVLLIESRDTLFCSYAMLVVLVAYQKSAPGADPPPRFLSPTLRATLALAIALLGVLPLIKGSYLIVSVEGAMAGFLLFWQAKAKGTALLFVTLPTLMMMMAWQLAGQPVSALPDYFSSMSDVISGYTDAMAIYPVNKNWLLLTIVSPIMIAVYLGVAAMTLEAIWRPALQTRFRRALLCLSVGLFLFVCFKAGFVRHDAHALTAGVALVLALIALQGFELADISRRTMGLAFITWAGIHSLYIGMKLSDAPLHNLLAAVSQSRTGDTLETAFHSELRAIHQHTQIPTLPGKSDIYPYDQAPLIASGNQWVTRPVLQSYCAYTPTLAARNAAFLQGPLAPDNIVFSVKPIDERYPSLEDGLSWPTLLTRYAVSASDQEYIYLKKREVPVVLHKQLLAQSRHQLGNFIDIPATSGILFAEIDIEASLIGRIANLAFKSSPLNITVQLKNGQSRSYRLIAGMAGAGFVLSPLVQSNADFLALSRDELQELKSNAITRLRIAPAEGGDIFWKPDYELRLTKLTGSVAAIQQTALSSDRLSGSSAP